MRKLNSAHRAGHRCQDEKVCMFEAISVIEPVLREALATATAKLAAFVTERKSDQSVSEEAILGLTLSAIVVLIQEHGISPAVINEVVAETMAERLNMEIAADPSYREEMHRQAGEMLEGIVRLAFGDAEPRDLMDIPADKLPIC